MDPIQVMPTFSFWNFSFFLTRIVMMQGSIKDRLPWWRLLNIMHHHHHRNGK